MCLFGGPLHTCHEYLFLFLAVGIAFRRKTLIFLSGDVKDFPCTSSNHTIVSQDTLRASVNTV